MPSYPPLHHSLAGDAGALPGEDVPRSGGSLSGDGKMPPHAQAQGASDLSEKKVIPLAEMGDIQPALDMLLRVQAEYSRGERGVSRAMRDVAYSALVREIERYCGR